MKIAVFGATGVLGQHLIPRLVEDGHKIYACTPSLKKLQQFIPLNVELTVNNILDRNSLLPAISKCETVIHIATAIPPPGPKRDWSLNDRIRREGTANLLSVCEEIGIKLYVQQSIAHLVNKPGTDWLTEQDLIKPSVITQSAADMEHLVINSKLNWQIIRGGSLYGPGTRREEHWFKLARQKELLIPKANGYISLIHVSDLAAAFVSVIKNNTHGLLFNIVDNEPVQYSQLYQYIAALLNAPVPSYGEMQELPSFRASNEKAKKVLFWNPHYASYRTGLAGLNK